MFVLWTGLKGAVPILLGIYIAGSGIPARQRAYEVIFVVVGFSVDGPGRPGADAGAPAAHPAADRGAGTVVAGRPVQRGARGPAPLSRGRPARPADGSAVGDLPCGEDVWVSLIVRDGNLVTGRGDTTLQAGDDVLVLAEPDEAPALDRLFTAQAGRRLTVSFRAGGGI